MTAIVLDETLWGDADEDIEALLQEWLVAPGAAVRAGQPVAVAVVVKAGVDVLAPADGVLSAIHVPAGETFARGAALGTIG